MPTGVPSARKLSLPAALTLIGILAFLLAGCASSSTSSNAQILPDSRQVFHGQLVTGSVDVKTLDPSIVQDVYSAVPISMLFPGLLTLNAAGMPIPWAATALPTFSASANTYTFTVRSGMKWSDGTPIDAHTFAYSINRSLDPCTGSTVSYYLFAIKDAQAFNTEKCGPDGTTIGGKLQSLIGDTISVPDPQTLVLTMNSAAPYFLAALTYPTSYAQPQQLITQYGAKNWTSHLTDNGGFGGNEFKLTVWDHAGHLDLVRNPTFWGTPPKLKEVDFKIYSNYEPEYADYLDGKIDEGTPPVSQYKSAAKRSDFHADGELVINYFQPTWNKAPFDDVRVRQAFDLALNKTVLANDVDQGTTIASNHIVPEGMPGYDPSLTGPDGTINLGGNVAKATALMQAYANDKCGGKISNCPAVTLVAASQSPYTTQDVAVVAMWEQAFPGLKIRTSFIDFNTLISVIYSPNVPQIYDILWIADYPDPQDWLSLQFAPTSTINVGFVSDPQANTLMAQADVNLNPTSRYQEYNQAEQSLVDNVAWIPYSEQKQYWDVEPYVHGFYLPAGQLVALSGPQSWQTMYLSAH